MRKISTGERRLLAIFGLMIFGFVNILALKWYTGKRQDLRSEIAELKNRALEYQTLLAEREHWEVRQQWLNEHPLDVHQGQDSESRFVEEIQRSLSEAALKINSQQIRESIPRGEIIETQMDFSVTGSLEQIARWIVRIQQPGNHLVIQSLVLKQVEGEGMIAQIRVGKIFQMEGVAQAP